MESVPTSKGEEMKEAIGADADIECSAKVKSNIEKVFETVIKVALTHPLPPEEDEPEKDETAKEGDEVEEDETPEND
jgi:hypothetical protein